MNVRNKLILLICVGLFSLFTACVKDDDFGCTQGINVRFYSKTKCERDTVYPQQIKDITLCLFDKNGVLVSYNNSQNIEIQRDYYQQVESGSGLYTAVAWSGLDRNHYDITNLEVGSTRKDDLMFRLKRTARQASSLEGNVIYFGESPVVYVPEANKIGSFFENTAINMQEITNRMTVIVEGLTRVDDYIVEIESDNGSMNFDGTIAQDEIIDHSSAITVKDGILEGKFTLLKLTTGNSHMLVIKNKITGNEVYRGSLLGTLLLKNPDVNLDCDHDFVIRFTAQDQCNCGTYAIMKIWVNNWLVHSYDTEL